jgi:hypothetical protein
MFDQLSAEILASLIKGFPTTRTTTTTTTKQNVDPAVYYVYSRVKTMHRRSFATKGFVKSNGPQSPLFLNRPLKFHIAQNN